MYISHDITGMTSLCHVIYSIRQEILKKRNELVMECHILLCNQFRMVNDVV